MMINVKVLLLFGYMILPLFHNVSYCSIFHIHMDINEFTFRFINIHINVKNIKMTYILRWRGGSN